MKVTFNKQLLNQNVIYTTSFLDNHQPHINSDKVKKGDLFTLLIVDPDAPYPSDPSKKYFLHFLIVNTKEIKASYHPPNPPRDSPPHRYMILLYKQPKYININYIGYSPNFNLDNFVKDNNLLLVDEFVFRCVS